MTLPAWHCGSAGCDGTQAHPCGGSRAGRELILVWCKSPAATPAPDPDDPVRLMARFAPPDSLDEHREWGAVPVVVRPSLIVFAAPGRKGLGRWTVPVHWVRLDLSGDHGSIYVERRKWGDSIDVESPCRAIPAPWRDV